MNTPPSAKSSIRKALVALTLAVGIVIFLFLHTGPPKGPDSSTSQPAIRLTTQEKAVFLDQSVKPILDANTTANAKALEILRFDIHKQFEGYRRRVPTFTEDITGIGNKTKITWETLKQMTSDDKKKVERQVTEKFEMHVVSANKMQVDLETLLKGFRRDIEANRNRMLVDIDAAVNIDPRFSPFGVKLPETFDRDIEAKILNLSKSAGNDVALLTSLNLIASAAADIAVTELVAAALARAGTSLAATIAVSGGTAAALTAGGGTVGTAGGPAGVVIGLAAGLAMGTIVDAVMSERLETKLNSECADFLTNSEIALTKNPDGLVAALNKALTELDKIKGPVIKQQIEALP